MSGHLRFTTYEFVAKKLNEASHPRANALQRLSPLQIPGALLHGWDDRPDIVFGVGRMGVSEIDLVCFLRGFHARRRGIQSGALLVQLERYTIAVDTRLI